MKAILSTLMALFAVLLATFGVTVATGCNPFHAATGVLVTGTIISLLPMSKIVLADYAATALLAARASIADALAGKINGNELRQPMTGGLMAYVQSTPDLILGGASTIASLRQGAAQPVNIPVVDQLSDTVDSARACTASEEGDSALVTPTFQTVSKGFAISVDRHKSNEVKFATTLLHNFSETFKKLHLDLDTKAIADLEANKSAVNDGSINTFNAGTDTMEVSLANKDQYFGSITTEMGENDFTGDFMNVHSLSQNLEISRQRNQGSANDENLQWQFDGFQHFGTGKVTNFSAATSTSYIFVPGTVGIIPWIKPKNRDGFDIGTDVWTTIADPFIPGWEWELKISKSCTDSSGTVTEGQDDLVWTYRVSGDFAYVNAYTSDTDTGIYKYHQLNS